MLKQDIEDVINRMPWHKAENSVFLIAGANGFLASCLVHVLMYLNKYYLKEKCTVLALCRNEEKAREKFKDYIDSENFRLCIQNVEESIWLDENVDYVVHAASNAVTSDFLKKPVSILSANMIGTYNLLEFSREKKIKGFLFFSSGAVYGEIPQDCEDVKEEDTFSLDFLQSRNCYAEGKRAGETLCSAYWEQYKVPTRIVRIGHTYGPGIDINDGRVFSDFVKNICSGENLIIKGTGTDVRPFCYITDAVAAFFLILFNGKSGEAYNMVNDRELLSIYELAEKLVVQAFPELNLKIVGSHLNYSTEFKKVEVKNDKLKGLGWTPQVDVIEGFRRTVQSFNKGE